MTTGRLYVVATPIGNLADITLRAVKILGEVQLIAAEDTRTTRVLLNHHGIATPLVAHHEHNVEASVRGILGRLESGDDVAIVSDAGTPSISDPGYALVEAAAAAGYEVIGLPGPSAVLAALVISGLPTDRFTFEGFLPRKGRSRSEALDRIVGSECTTVIFESVHRIDATLTELATMMGDRRAALCRELTKLYEEVRRGTLIELAESLKVKPVKGEIALVIAGRSAEPASVDDAYVMALKLIDEGSSPRDAVNEAVARTGVPKGELYQRVIDRDK